MKRKRRMSPVFKNFILAILLVSSVLLSVASVKEVLQVFSLKASIAEAITTQEELLNKKEDLLEKKKNLENPEYLLRYARGKYLVTKDDGEQVFKLPEE